MKKRVSLLTLVLACLLLPMMVSGTYETFIISQSGEWSDDFDDGDIVGWTTQGWDENFTSVPANINADDFTLRAYGENQSQAYHESNLTVGYWAFDLHCVSVPNNHFYVAFISGPAMDPGDNATIPYEYGLMPIIGQFGGLDHAFVLYKRTAGSPSIEVLTTYDAPVVSGWYHVEITRDSSGRMEVFFNGTSRIVATNNDYATSEIFSFYSYGGPALDNIVVQTEAPTSPTTTSPTVPPEPVDLTMVLVVGGLVAVVVIVVLVVRMRK